MTRSFTLLDGGMGKHLSARGAPFRQPEWSALSLIEDPRFVARAHEDFVAVGADTITTNNYAVVPYHLGEGRFLERGAELCDLSGRLAREVADAAGRPVRVAGSIPPLFGSYEPEAFRPDIAPPWLEIITDALAPHVDLFLPETQASTAEASASTMAARRHDHPVWAAFTLQDSLVDELSVLRSGESVTATAQWAVDAGVDALLFNCSQPEFMSPAVVEARAVLPGSIEVGVYANTFESKPAAYAANGTILEHRADLDGDAYAAFVERWLDEGASIVGGCCGVMPSQIAAIDELRRP